MSTVAIRNRGYGKVTGLRPEHCQGERYADWSEVAPVLEQLNRRTCGGRTMAVRCGICNGWHLQAGAGRQEGNETDQ